MEENKIIEEAINNEVAKEVAETSLQAVKSGNGGKVAAGIIGFGIGVGLWAIPKGIKWVCGKFTKKKDEPEVVSEYDTDAEPVTLEGEVVTEEEPKKEKSEK